MSVGKDGLDTSDLKNTSQACQWNGRNAFECAGWDGLAWISAARECMTVVLEQQSGFGLLGAGWLTFPGKWERLISFPMWNRILDQIVTFLTQIHTPLKSGYATSSSQEWSGGKELSSGFFRHIQISLLNNYFWNMVAKGTVERSMVGKLLWWCHFKEEPAVFYCYGMLV